MPCIELLGQLKKWEKKDCLPSAKTSGGGSKTAKMIPTNPPILPPILPPMLHLGPKLLIQVGEHNMCA